MKIRIGGPYGVPVQYLDATHVTFVSDDERDAFDVQICGNGSSISVCAIGSFKADGVIYEGRIMVIPNASNVVTIQAKPHT
jgi:hypothetical protein